MTLGRGLRAGAVGFVSVILLLLLAPAGARGQAAGDPSGGLASASEPSPTPIPYRRASRLQQSAADTTASPVSPGGAFLRSLVVPGWGHAAVGSYTRAGFYFTSSAATGWMLFKTARSLDAAETRRDLLEAETRAGLEAEGISDPDSVSARLDDDPRVQSLRGLVEARSQQMEDWTAFGLFWLLLNGADAFVSAHLADFPEPVEVDIRTGGPEGTGELRISVPFGGGGSRPHVPR